MEGSALEEGGGARVTAFSAREPEPFLYNRVGERPPRRGTTLNIDDAKFFSRCVFAMDTEEIESIRPRKVSPSCSTLG